MRVGRRERGPLVIRLGVIAPEPVLAGLEGTDHGMILLGRMVHRVLRGRAVAAADVPAVGATSQVEPPATSGIALHASGPRWWELRTDRIGCHQRTPVVTARIPRRSRVDGRWRRTGRARPPASPRAGAEGRRRDRARP